jgi:hypothetical protein
VSFFGLPRSSLPLLAVSFLLRPAGVTGQVWSVDAYAGQASYSIAPGTVDSRNGILGLRFNQDRRFFQVAGGVPLSETDVAWGVLGLGDRLAFRRGGMEVGVDMALLAHGQRDPVSEVTGQGVLVDLLPMFSHNVGSLVLEARSGLRWYGARLGEADWTRVFWTSEVRGAMDPAATLRLEGTLRHHRGGEEETYSRAAASATSVLGPAVVQGTLGHWVEGPDGVDPEWGVVVGLPMGPRGQVFASVRRESFDPHYLMPPRTSWGVGVSLKVGRRPGPVPVAGPEVRRGGRVVIRIPLRDCTAPPLVAGDFTGWEPVPMERQGTEWRYTLRLPPGVYRFAFRRADGEWFVPASVPNRMDDGMGGWVAVLVVP